MGNDDARKALETAFNLSASGSSPQGVTVDRLTANTILQALAERDSLAAECEGLIEAAAALRNAAYGVMPRQYPASLNHPDSAGPAWEREYVADRSHYRISMDAMHALDMLLRKLPAEIESRGVELARAAIDKARTAPAPEPTP